MANSSGTATASGDTAGEAVSLDGDVPFAARSMGSFDEPWAIAVQPGTGDVFVTEKPGTAKIYRVASGKVADVTGLPAVAYEGQGGLGDVAFAPDFDESGTVYLTWAKGDGDGKKRAALGRGKLVCASDTQCSISGFRMIWQQSLGIEGAGHYSHKIAFSPDGRYLFLSSGERQQMTPAQDTSNNLGSVVRLNLDGTPAAGNPFADKGGAPDIWSYGHRNLLGLEFDLAGNLWDIEHGPRGGDELNLVKEGANYGWPVRSNGINYDGSNIPDHSADDGFTKPAISWTPVIGPGDFIFYRGSLWPWTGEAVIANLTVEGIARVKVDAAANTATEVARYKFPNRLRDIAEAADGSLWVIEDGEDGRLLRLTPRN